MKERSRVQTRSPMEAGSSRPESSWEPIQYHALPHLTMVVEVGSWLGMLEADTTCFGRAVTAPCKALVLDYILSGSDHRSDLRLSLHPSQTISMIKGCDNGCNIRVFSVRSMDGAIPDDAIGAT